MPVFEYKALNIKGKTISGIIDAGSALAARHKLRESRIFPTAIKEVTDTTPQKDTRTIWELPSFGRVTPAEIAMMTRQLATLLGAGFPLVTAIDTLVEQTKAPAFKRIIARLKDSIVEGNSFADSLSLYPGTFSSLYINMVRAGETSGTLEIVLERLADISEKQQDLKQRIRSAMTYPILMLIIGLLVLFFLLTFIVPSITSIFDEMNQVLPAPTRLLIGVSDFFKSFWWLILVVAIGFLVAAQFFRRMPKGRYFFDQLNLKLPILGQLINKLAVARFARTLGSLLENGVTMLQSLEIVRNIAGNLLIADSIDRASGEVEKGEGLGNALANGQVFPHLSIQMIQVGEQSGELEPMLNKIADVYEKEVESKILSLTTLLEPIMILVMGLLVGFIVLSICLPIFEMNQLVR
ncbi:MAG: type II secretion system inner membrane protein GspF [Desulfobacterales bacterium]|nr:type II secretion system inner membrane protein GspF [Desulfobacterales bacterium]MDJ0913877.1 type II secretion system inner membrane protein GspF [Desulfobacterales bacterium]